MKERMIGQEKKTGLKRECNGVGEREGSSKDGVLKHQDSGVNKANDSAGMVICRVRGLLLAASHT